MAAKTRTRQKVTVRDVVLEHPEARSVFERFRVDYCCGGDRPLAEAAVAAGVDVAELTAAIEAAGRQKPSGGRDWTGATLTELVDHIEHVHHGYMRGALPRIAELFDKVMAAHGQRHGTVLRPLKGVFGVLRAEIEQHMRKEEAVLFPYIRGLNAYVNSGGRTPTGRDGSVRNPVRVMRLEHDDAGKALARMRALTTDYALPEDACESFHALYDALAEIERDLHEHIHLENNILFPKALAMEKACWGA